MCTLSANTWGNVWTIRPRSEIATLSSATLFSFITLNSFFIAVRSSIAMVQYLHPSFEYTVNILIPSQCNH
ncbi:hypothetical protein ATCV1_z142L [Acanthocystis turfacea chlorella virus 1]|uniref:Uncharacterized protein z142L n=1 Tax=Chlorovirus heliozoae TaxID=322019 RepID=A7K8A2_9PHYC|nr:hypothetical protein ATCV1_z142L [Acanthocystis turfacea chlorella virus 1]ABT16276.1 hypothetical protein ATCV1_z142L [Acanthocystis turfacea chlorella virus 1]